MSTRSLSPDIWLLAAAEMSPPKRKENRRQGPREARRTERNDNLRESQRESDRLSKENFDLKLKIHSLEEDLAKYCPKGIAAAKRTRTQLEELAKKLSARSKELDARSQDLEARSKDIETKSDELHGLIPTQENPRNHNSRKHAKQVCDLEDQLEAIKALLEDTEAKLESTAAKLELTEASLDAAETKLVATEAKLAVTETQLEATEAKLITTEAENGALQASFEHESLAGEWHSKDLQEKIISLEGELTNANAKLDSSHTELEISRKESLAAEGNAKDLQEKIISLESELTHANAKLDSSHAELEILRNESLAAEGNSKDLRAKITGLESQLANANGKVDARQTELENLRTEFLAAEGNSKDLRTKITGLRNELANANAKFDARQTELEIVRKESRAADGNSKDLRTKITGLRNELADATAKFDARETEMKRLFKEQATRYEARETDLKKRNSHLERLMKRDDQVIDQFTAELGHEIVAFELLVEDRDARLDAQGLELRNLSASLEAERQAHRDQQQLSHDRLRERNQTLLAVWKQIGQLCGSDWQNRNNLVNNHVPTEEVVDNMLPDFTRSLNAGLDTLKSIIKNNRSRVVVVEQDLWASYQALIQKVDGTSQKVQELETNLQAQRLSGTFTAVPELTKLRGENRLLKSELAQIDRATIPNISESSEQRWLHRIRDLERRLKAEREARLLDRAGARTNLQLIEAENDLLRQELLTERTRR